MAEKQLLEITLCMYVCEWEREKDYLLAIQSYLLLLSTRHTEVIGMPGDTFLNPHFLKKKT